MTDKLTGSKQRELTACTSAEFEFLVSWILGLALEMDIEKYPDRFADAVMRFKMKLMEGNK